MLLFARFVYVFLNPSISYLTTKARIAHSTDQYIGRVLPPAGFITKFKILQQVKTGPSGFQHHASPPAHREWPKPNAGQPDQAIMRRLIWKRQQQSRPLKTTWPDQHGAKSTWFVYR
jgi:hypothetical protein